VMNRDPVLSFQTHVVKCGIGIIQDVRQKLQRESTDIEL
jgi:hypothetical protein